MTRGSLETHSGSISVESTSRVSVAKRPARRGLKRLRLTRTVGRRGSKKMLHIDMFLLRFHGVSFWVNIGILSNMHVSGAMRPLVDLTPPNAPCRPGVDRPSRSGELMRSPSIGSEFLMLERPEPQIESGTVSKTIFRHGNLLFYPSWGSCDSMQG